MDATQNLNRDHENRPTRCVVRNAEIARRYLSGEKSTHLAREYRLSRQRVLQIVLASIGKRKGRTRPARGDGAKGRCAARSGAAIDALADGGG